MAAARACGSGRAGAAWGICRSAWRSVQRMADMTAPAEDYLAKCTTLIETVRAQLPVIAQVADLFSATILAGRIVHVFASGHSRIMLEELWPRYGSFPGFNPIVELS